MADTITLNVTNMKCGGCVSAVEQALLAVDGVASATVSLDDANAVVTGSADIELLVKASTDAGFPATPQ